MRSAVKFLGVTSMVLITAFSLSSFFSEYGKVNKTSFSFPFQKGGLTERQAAAHLLNRFTYGATPGQVDAVVKMGLENWFKQQLQANMPDDSLNQVLDRLDAVKLTNEQIVNEYPKGGQVLRMAIKDGLINKDSAKVDQKAYRDQIQAYLQQKGMKPERELFRQFIVQKILRSTYTNNQLQEVMTDFWFNHFNVSITKNDCSQFIPAYERDVIRPNALGKFNEILLATAKSPAMLYYLDNFSSTGTNTNLNNSNALLRQRLLMALPNNNRVGDTTMQSQIIRKAQQAKKAQGLNENYAREVMELHTLGVDGGYTQQDVTQAARVLTGWTVYPMGNYGNNQNLRKQIDRAGENTLSQRGFVHDGDFLFTPNRHDNGEKIVMGVKFGPNGGYQEGVQLLNMLAHQQATAKFITRKIAVRFVSDNPPQSLLDKMTQTFMTKDGDIKAVLTTMVSAPEFWGKEAVREKTKSPFELAIGAVRALHATIFQPYQLYTWIDKMGQKMYFYQAPTGFPDRAQYWINTGSLLNRMNFGLALASNRIPGVHVDLAALNNHHEPESAQAALITYARLIMPERNMDATLKQLTPMLNDPNLMKKVDEAATKTTVSPATNDVMGNDMMTANSSQPLRLKGGGNGQLRQLQGDNTMLAQVVGVVVGSPEYQRR
ncbi:MAG: DUF1800 domain-containing protein [Mucilaginibacter sp.]